MLRHTKKNKPADYVREITLVYTHSWVPAGTPIDGYSRDSEGNLLVIKRGYWEPILVTSMDKRHDPESYLNTRLKDQQPQKVSQ